MRLIHINLKDSYPGILTKDVYLDGLIFDKSVEYAVQKRKSVLILPGGGYEFVSYREKDPIMTKFNSLGFHAFSLSYSCLTPYPTPHLELMCAMHYLNTNHHDLGIFPKQVSLVGFSAGGHLACSYAGIYKSLSRFDDASLLRPKALVLAYPVTSLVKTNNPQCVENICHFNKKMMHILSADENVDKDYPPTFMWTTKDDKEVNPNNVVWLRDALKKHKVKNKCIIYPSGPHGLSLANEATSNGDLAYVNKKVSEWPELASEFINSIKE